LLYFIVIGVMFFVINSIIQVFSRAAERKFDYKRYGAPS
jgi:ABC-type amino acid transport system permease subunit